MQKNDQLNEMLYKASHDALTGILNRGAIERKKKKKCTQSEEAKLARHLIMFDVDDFKQINDTFGHAIGDKVLISISTIVGDYLSTIPGAIFGRWGGEEFMIFVYGQSDDLAKDIADKILDKIKNETLHEREVTVSIGVTKHYPHESVMQALTRADELLYSSKSNGKARVTCDF